MTKNVGNEPSKQMSIEQMTSLHKIRQYCDTMEVQEKHEHKQCLYPLNNLDLEDDVPVRMFVVGHAGDVDRLV